MGCGAGSGGATSRGSPRWSHSGWWRRRGRGWAAIRRACLRPSRFRSGAARQTVAAGRTDRGLRGGAVSESGRARSGGAVRGSGRRGRTGGAVRGSGRGRRGGAPGSTPAATGRGAVRGTGRRRRGGAVRRTGRRRRGGAVRESRRGRRGGRRRRAGQMWGRATVRAGGAVSRWRRIPPPWNSACPDATAARPCASPRGAPRRRPRRLASARPYARRRRRARASRPDRGRTAGRGPS
jgi:hypothetical protein